MQVLPKDRLELSINIWTSKGLLEFRKFKWLMLSNVKLLKESEKIITTEMGSNQANKLISDYDLTKYCELEIMKNKWKPLEKLTNYKNVFNSMRKMFEPAFVIERILWDDVGYMLFKIYLKGKNPGCNTSPKELGILLEVKDKNELVSNEIKKNCILFDRKNTLQVHIDDQVIFYISKSK